MNQKSFIISLITDLKSDIKIFSKFSDVIMYAGRWFQSYKQCVHTPMFTTECTQQHVALQNHFSNAVNPLNKSSEILFYTYMYFTH